MSTSENETTGWLHPDTTPSDGYEFEYLCDDGRVRRGSLGGSIERDSRMIGWRPMDTRDRVIWRNGGYRSVQ